MPQTIGKRLIADVFDLAFWQDGKLAIVAEDLQTSSIDCKITEKEVRGGKGNKKITTLYSGRTMSVKAENPVFDFGVLATNLGSDIVIGSHLGYTQRVKGEVRVNGTTKFLYLGREPLSTEILEVFHKGTLLTLNTDYKWSGKVITFLSSSILEGDAVQVNPYKFKTNATAKKISINSDTYAKGGTLVLTTYEIDTETKRESQIQFVFPNAIPSGNFTINTKSEVDASNQALEFSINNPENSDEIGYITEDEYVDEVDKVSVPTIIPVVLPFSSLAGTSSVAGEIDLTFGAIGDSTSVAVKYKLSSATLWSEASVGTTGIYIASAVSNSDTTKTIEGLSSGTYDVKFVITGGTYAGDSNIVTNIVVA